MSDSRQRPVIRAGPLGFLEEGGKNRIPEKLPQSEREDLFTICDESLREVVTYLESSSVS